ncbi:MAG: sugar-transfer associated ATP-grasp domain-containing protein, partial [Thermoleophilia bacterium]
PRCAGADQMVSHMESCTVQGLVDAAGVGLVSDKIVLALMAPALGIPMPTTHAVLSRMGSGWSWHTSRAVAPWQWAETIDDLPDHIVVKPAEGYGGNGVRVLSRVAPGLWCTPDGTQVDTAELVAQLRADREFSVWLCDQRVINHPVLAELGAPGVLKTLRVASLVRQDGHPEVMWAVLRLATEGMVDNVRGGARGVMAWVDVRTGRLTRALSQRPDAPGLEDVTHDPVTGNPLVGTQLPMWQEVCDLSHLVAHSMLPLRTLGHDIAITPDGPLLIETNAFYDPAPGFPMRPAMDAILEAAGMPEAVVSS